MNKIISISREYGSGGHEIGEKFAKKLYVPFYDRSLSEIAASNIGIDNSKIEELDEKAASSFMYSLVMNNAFINNASSTNMTAQDRMFAEQSRLIEEYAQKGSCVIVGRCSDYILRDNPDCIHIFICASIHSRVQRIMQKKSLSESNATALVRKTDKARASYYQHYTSKKWGSPTSYDICINTDSSSLNDVVDLLVKMFE
ncbi:MAG: cytidylate kinase-like family protein [Clostridia bacterium]|nr:cytidylate kinase-like family protein [Clostridia bacterium]